MNLYILRQDVNSGYDTYDSVVVAAETAEDARKIIPGGFWLHERTKGLGLPVRWLPASNDGPWAAPKDVRVDLLGTSVEGLEAGAIICASFNAG